MQGLNSAPASFDYAYTDGPNRDTTRAIARTPDEAGAHNLRGIAYSENGDQDRAIAEFSQAIALKPDFAEAYNNRGIAYGEKGEYDLAIEDYNKTIQLRPNSADAYNNRGAAYINKGEIDRAIKDCSKAIELNPNYAKAYYNRGLAYGNGENCDRGIEDFNKAIALKPDFVEAYDSRGAAYINKGEIDRAIKDCSKAIELNPNYAKAYSNRGAAYGFKDDPDRVIEDFNTAIGLNPNFAEFYYNRGVSYGLKGDYDRAIEDFNTAIGLNPNFAKVYYTRGVIYGEKGDFDCAIANYNMAIERNPDFANAYSNRGAAYSIKGDFDRAIKDCSKVIELNPSDVSAYNNRGLAYGGKGDYDHAIEDLTKAIALNPNYVSAYNNRGITYSDKGDFDRGIEDFNKVIQFNPDDAIAYNNRGKAWLHLKEWDKARADLTAAKDLGRDIIAAFHNEYESVEAYERKNRVKLPEDIAARLTQRRRSRYPKTEKFLGADGMPLESPDVLNLLAKLRSTGTPLSQYVQMRPIFGIKTGRSGAFVVDSATRDLLIAEHPSSADILKPFLHGRDIRRWQVARPDSWLIFTCRRIEINRYPAIRKHLEKHRSSLSKRTGKQKWYELPATKSDAEHFTQTKLVCPNSYDHQTFAVDTEGFYCGDTCYLIPTEETWLCGLLNSRVVEWFYAQASNQLTGDYLRARSRYMQEIPIPDLSPTQKSLIGKIVDYLIYLQGQPTTNSEDLAHARDAVMLKYFERIIDGLIYEAYLGEELHQGEKQFFKPLLNERLPQLEEIRDDKMSALREIFERLYERTHPVRSNLFFLDSVRSIRIIEGKA